MLVDFGRNSSPYYTAHFGKHILNQRPSVHHKTSDPKISSHMFDLCRNGSPYYTAHFGKHILNFLNQFPKVHHKTSDPKILAYASL